MFIFPNKKKKKKKRRQLSSHGQMNMKAQYNKSGKICPTQVPCHTLTQIKLQNLSVMPAQLD